MNICLVNSYYPPWIGGAETYVSNVARGLNNLGHDVTVYCSKSPLRAGETYEDGIRVIRMQTPLKFYGTPITILPKDLLRENYHVIHSNFPGPYLASISACVAKATNTPSLLTWHNDLPPVTSAASLIVKLHDIFSYAYLNIYKKIIATTNIYARNSKTLKRYSNKLVVMRNGVDTSKFNPKVRGDSIREKFHLGDCSVGLFVGALTTWHAYKGVDVLIPAFKKVHDIDTNAKLVIVGEGNLSDGYKALASKLGISSSVIFAGKVEQSELPSYYAASDYVVLPSKDSSEGFGLALLEAMATGKAVIGSRVGGIPEVIIDGLTGILVGPNNVDELAKAMSSLVQYDEARSLMGRNGRLFAASNDWTVVAKKLDSLYREIQ